MSVRVKVCGLCDEAAVDAAVEAGADALGFVLAPSPRRVTLARAAELLARVPAGFERVAVFARASAAELRAALALGFDAVQAELGSEFDALDGSAFVLPVLRDGLDLERRLAALAPAQSLTGRSLRGAVVLDGPRGGGRGIPVDEARARGAARARPIVRPGGRTPAAPPPRPIVLAGGLTPASVEARIRAIHPFAVDASSGLERERGRKDPELIRAFVAAARASRPDLDPAEKHP